MWWVVRILSLIGVLFGASAHITWLIWVSVIVGLPFWFTSEARER